MYTCRECEREINQATEVCPHCGADLTAETQDAGTTQKKASLAKLILRYAILVLAMWAFLWYVLPEQEGSDAAAQAEARALEALRETGAALAAYAGAREGSFPATLDALPAESAARVREVAQAALREGYRLEYSVAPGGSGDALKHFALLARPRNYGYRNFYLDETGVIRVTKENRPANAQDPQM